MMADPLIPVQPFQCPECNGVARWLKRITYVIDGGPGEEEYRICDPCKGTGVIWRPIPTATPTGMGMYDLAQKDSN